MKYYSAQRCSAMYRWQSLQRYDGLSRSRKAIYEKAIALWASYRIHTVLITNTPLPLDHSRQYTTQLFPSILTNRALLPTRFPKHLVRSWAPVSSVATHIQVPCSPGSGHSMLSTELSIHNALLYKRATTLWRPERVAGQCRYHLPPKERVRIQLHWLPLQ